MRSRFFVYHKKITQGVILHVSPLVCVITQRVHSNTTCISLVCVPLEKSLEKKIKSNSENFKLTHFMLEHIGTYSIFQDKMHQNTTNVCIPYSRSSRRRSNRFVLWDGVNSMFPKFHLCIDTVHRSHSRVSSTNFHRMTYTKRPYEI